MSVNVMINGTNYPVEVWKFPAGEVGVKCNVSGVMWRDYNCIKYTLNFESNDDLMVMAQLDDIIKPSTNTVKWLSMPYIPYARQDRKMSQSEANSLKVFAKFINTFEFNSVEVVDPHSDVAEGVIENIKIFSQEQCVKSMQGEMKKYFDVNSVKVVAPDTGALKKIYKIAKLWGTEFITASKVRDVQTGKIVDTVVHSHHLGNQDLIVVDDICDGGATFIELAKKLKEITNGDLYLYVTHGIFSKGLDELSIYYKQILTYNNIRNLIHPQLVSN